MPGLGVLRAHPVVHLIDRFGPYAWSEAAYRDDLRWWLSHGTSGLYLRSKGRNRRQLIHRRCRYIGRTEVIGCAASFPEPILRVATLSEFRIRTIPIRSCLDDERLSAKQIVERYRLDDPSALREDLAMIAEASQEIPSSKKTAAGPFGTYWSKFDSTSKLHVAFDETELEEIAPMSFEGDTDDCK